MTVLAEIVAAARHRAAALDPVVAGAEASPAARAETAPGAFAAALRGAEGVALIAEFKRRSPSRGAIALDADVAAVVRDYERGGAAAVSVLTEPTRFGGNEADLAAAVAACSLPVLMKDFVMSPRQVERAAQLGAAAVLLLVRCVDGVLLEELGAACAACGVAALVECHTEAELEAALAIEGAIIGANNRDLETLGVDLSVAPRLLRAVPHGRLRVAESGYSERRQLDGLLGIADGVLVGTALMRRRGDLLSEGAQ